MKKERKIIDKFKSKEKVKNVVYVSYSIDSFDPSTSHAIHDIDRKDLIYAGLIDKIEWLFDISKLEEISKKKRHQKHKGK